MDLAEMAEWILNANSKSEITKLKIYMCGIIGYVGKKAASPILLEGLRRLEYRGYDSAGVAVLDATPTCGPQKKGQD